MAASRRFKLKYRQLLHHNYLLNTSRHCTILSQTQRSDTQSPFLSDAQTQTPITDRLTNSSSPVRNINIINPQRLGKVIDVTNTIATVDGFTSAKPHSLVEFDNGVRGLVLNVDSNGCKIGIIDNGKH